MSFKMDWCTHEAAKYAVENWHYSGCMPVGKITKIGVWEHKRFIGCVLFSRGACSALGKSYGFTQTESCELTRIALTKHEIPVSKILAYALKMLKKISPGLRLVVSFADPEQSHYGGVYQANGWIFTGKSAASTEYIYKGKRYQGRGFRLMHPKMENHPSVTKILGSSKYRYLMPLDIETRNRLQKLSKPYPKRAGSKDIVAKSYQGLEGGENPTSALQE